MPAGYGLFDSGRQFHRTKGRANPLRGILDAAGTDLWLLETRALDYKALDPCPGIAIPAQKIKTLLYYFHALHYRN